MSFFDSTPLGRVLNRFSKDTYVIDENIPSTVRWYVGSMAKIIGVVIYITIVTPLFILGLIPISIGYYAAQRYYIKTSRELARLDSLSRSPIYALFSETLDGLTTIRAYLQEERFFQKNNKALDANQQAYFLNFSANCWLGVRLEFAGTLIITFAALFAVLGIVIMIIITAIRVIIFTIKIRTRFLYSFKKWYHHYKYYFCRDGWIVHLLSTSRYSVIELECPYGIRSRKSNGIRRESYRLCIIRTRTSPYYA